MPLIAGEACVTMTTYLRSARRVMSFASYWEPETPAETYADMVAAANDYYTQFYAVWKELGDGAVTVEGVSAVQQQSATYLDAYSTNGGGIGEGGDETGETALPDMLSLVIQKRTSQPGREKRGRMFIPGISEEHNANGFLISTSAGVADDLAAFFGADRTFDGRVHHARHWQRKGTDALLTITHCRAMRELRSLRSREIPGINLPVAVAP